MSLFPRLIAVFPTGVGLCLLFGLWGGGMGDPPFMFKVFGSFVAFFFMTVGFGFFTAAGKLGDPQQLARSLEEMTRDLPASQRNARSAASESADAASPKIGYDCPSCGAALGNQADVSPSGDVKCGYCERWFNIHSEG